MEDQPRRVKYVLILGALSAFGPLSIDMYLPAFPTIAGDLQAGPSQVQLSLTACTVGLALGQLVAGPLSDTFGRRRPLLIGLVVFTLASLLCAVAPSAYALAGLRLVQGLGGAAGIVIARAVVRDLYSGVAMARFFSLLMLVNGLAPILAPLIGGQMLRVTSWRGVFLVLGVIGVVLLVATAFGVRETLPGESRRPGSLGSTLRTFGSLLGDRAFVGYSLSAALAFAAMFAYISGSSFVLQDVYGMSPQLFSLVFGVNSLGIVLFGQLNGRLVARVDPSRLLAIGLGVNAVGGVAVALSAAFGLGLPGLLPALFLVASSIGVVFPNATTLALSGHPETAGSASALLGVMQFLAGGLAAPLVGSAGTGTALPMGVVMGALSLSAVVVYLVLTRGARLEARSGERAEERTTER
ncbi:Bcr/CflA family multidrug efflux MFS transporter [Saccharopolyspora shandongensis]|uniref:Bcr/CflA family multidrug efflux MFS transporter n=1 Tax=Saccharopolyspora shandongensis TaxID=418495 RepID=UPI0033ECDDE2